MLINVILVFICLIYTSSSTVQRKAIVLDRYEYCKVPASSAFIVGPTVLKTINYKTYINGSFELLRDIPILKVVGTVTRCANKEQLDSCAYFTTIPINNACPILAQKGTILSPLLYSFTPPAVCPFRKGLYVQVNSTFDPNLVQFFPLDKWYWKISLDYYDVEANEYGLTLCIEGHIVSYYL